ncbi:hypothetical protein WJX81_003890 [Elliptochloris bilobata]|uniref:ABC transporter domain-containing protein n=1 Tax=Elliptochloris bilobata TaxID=381761 RepID=A0AAW1RI39_9CHLO
MLGPAGAQGCAVRGDCENGAGKSTLLRLLAGLDEPDAGSVVRRRNASVGFLAQELHAEEGRTALDVVLAGSPAAAALRAHDAATSALNVNPNPGGAELAALARAGGEVEALGGWEVRERAAEALAELGLGPDVADRPVSMLSGGQRRRVGLAAALMAAPDLLVLDEPTNHLDVAAIQWLERKLTARGTTLAMVTHDRAFMEASCTSVLELDCGSAHLHSFGGPGSYARFRQARKERRAAQANAAQGARILLRKETEWIRRQPKARGTKAAARVRAFAELTSRARDTPQGDTRVTFGGAGMQRQGNKVLVMEGAGCDVAGRAVICDFCYDFAPGERIGVVGRNGTGKTTLLDLIAGARPLGAGARTEGETTRVAYLTQEAPAVAEGATMLSHLREQADVGTEAALGSSATNDAAVVILERLGLPRSRHRTLVQALSGGERRRLQLAAALLGRPNVLLLDEPTNDLDLGSVEALEALLANFAGCVLTVSHDRAFMADIAARLFVLRGDGVVRLFEGSYEEYLELAEEEERAAAAAATAAADEQRRQSRNQRAASSPTAAADPGSAATPSRNGSGGCSSGGRGASRKLRLGFREAQEFAGLEAEIDRMGAERDALSAHAAAAATSGDYVEAAALGQRLAEAEQAIDQRTERWLELAELAEG